MWGIILRQSDFDLLFAVMNELIVFDFMIRIFWVDIDFEATEIL